MSGTTTYTATIKSKRGDTLTVSMVLMGLFDSRNLAEVVEAITVIEGEIAVRVARLLLPEDRQANEVMSDIAILRSLHLQAAQLYEARWQL